MRQVKYVMQNPRKAGIFLSWFQRDQALDGNCHNFSEEATKIFTSLDLLSRSKSSTESHKRSKIDALTAHEKSGESRIHERLVTNWNRNGCKKGLVVEILSVTSDIRNHYLNGRD